MGSRLPTNLPQLQDFIKRDSESYKEEFESQYVYYTDAKEIFKLTPSTKDKTFSDLVMFIAHVAQFYPNDEELREFPNDLVSLLKTHGPVLHPDVRMGLFKALKLMRKKDLLPPMELFDVCFDLLRCQDKALRGELQQHIIQDIKDINAKSKNMVLNKNLQEFLSKKLADSHAVAVKTALDVMIELYKKAVWRDQRTVNIIVTGCYSKVAKIMVAALKFFLGNDEGEEDESSDSDSDDDAPNVKKALLAMRVNKKTKQKRQNHVDKIKKAANENKRKKNKKVFYDFSALHLINDPQTVAENIFKIFNKRNERFEVKLLMMNMVSRLIGVHQLYLSTFYPTLQRFLFPHQREVTKVMAYAAQAAHPFVPPDDLQPVVRSLANNFVTERYSSEVMAMGLNAIRELCSRNIHVMDEDLLQDLVSYKDHKDKGVYMAARSLMALYRQRNPSLLARNTRGAPTELLKEETLLKFGENPAKGFIPGAEILSFKTKGDSAVERDGVSDDESSGEEDQEDDMDCSESNKNETIDSVGEESESEEYDSDCDGDGEEEVKKNKKASDSQSDETEKENKSVRLNKKQAIREVMKLTPGERAAKAAEVVSSRFLTDEDFGRIDAVQAAKQVERYKGKNKKPSQKRKIDCLDEDDSEIVKLSSIEMIYKKRRHDKQSRVQAVIDGREDRDKFGSRKGRSNPHASTTNREKSKGKSFDMVKHKKRYAKMKSSFRDKQARLKKSMLRQLKNN